MAPAPLAGSSADVVLANDMNRARLRSAVTHLFAVAQLCAYMQLVEVALQHAVAVKVHQSAVRRLQPAVVPKSCARESNAIRIEGPVLGTSTPNPKFVPGSGTDVVWGTEKDPAVVAKTCEQEPGVARIE